MKSGRSNDLDGVAGLSLTVLEGLNALGFGLLVVRPPGTIVAVDDLACAISGRSRAELVALADFSTCIAPEERHRVAERRRMRVAEPLAPRLIDSVLIRPDESRVPVEWSTVELGRGTDDMHLVVVLRETSEAAARDLMIARYEQLIQRTPIAVLIWDALGVDDALDMRLLSANDAAVSALPVLAGDRVGERLGDIFPVAAPDAARTFALRGTGAVDFFPDYVVGDPERPTSVHRRQAIDLAGGAIAFVMENVTGERIESLRRRRLLERLVDAGDDERRTIAMAVHDEPVQQLAAATMLVEALRRRPDSADRELRLEEVERSLRAAMSTLRRLVFELSPPELVDSGLRGALDSAVANLFSGSDVVVKLDVDLPEEPAAEVQTAAFRIAAEALTNIRQHAAAMHVLVAVYVRGDMLHVDITDNGTGFGARKPGRLGLRKMGARATSLGGECNVTSGPDGTGVYATVPLIGRHATNDVAFAARLDNTTPHDHELQALRRERDSLMELNERQRASVRRLDQQLDVALALWATLDDDAHTVADLVHQSATQVAELCGGGCGIRLLSHDGYSWGQVGGWHGGAEQLASVEALLPMRSLLEPSHADVALRSNAAVLLDRKVEQVSAILAPIRIGGEARGLLTVVRSATETCLTEVDVELIQRIADRLGAALARRGVAFTG